MNINTIQKKPGIPKKELQTASVIKPKTAKAIGKKVYVTALIVEDDPIQAEFLEIDLTRVGFNVIGKTNDVGLGVALSENLKPDVIFVDIELKGEITGILAAQIIVDELDIPVVYVSSHLRNEFGAALAMTFPLAYLTKPYSEKGLEKIYHFFKERSPMLTPKDVPNGFLTMCAWTKKVKVNEKWIPIEEFLRKWCGFEIDMGVTPEIIKKFKLKIDSVNQSKNHQVRVLIVEDDAVQAELFKIDLQKIGFEVVGILMESITAVSKASRLKPDGVFMDVELQGHNTGVWAGEIISEKLNIPVIYVSVHPPEEFAISKERSTPVAYLTKPYTSKELSELLKFFKGYKSIIENNDKKIMMCAWTKRVHYNGNWISVDEFLKNTCGITISHGISPEVEKKLSLFR